MSKFIFISRHFSREKCPTLTVAFLVGAFSFKEKSPTITVASFFFFLVGTFSFKEKSPTITVASFFFRQITELIAYVPLFTETDKTTQAKFDQCKLTAKGPLSFFYLFYVTYKTGRLQRVPRFNFFSALCEFFSKIFNVSKKSPLRIF